MPNIRKTKPPAQEKFDKKAKLYAEQVAYIADNLGKAVASKGKNASMESLLIPAAIIHSAISQQPKG